MVRKEIVIVGGGPAGLCAALQAGRLGAQVTLLEGDDLLGGQLVKQTHMFFGSQKQHAGIRGIDIAAMLQEELRRLPNVEIKTNAMVLGRYEDGSVTIDDRDQFKVIHPQKMVIATGASEKMLAFPNNDLPGVYGAGALQTLMNVYGVKPARRVLMVGAGNIGLIVSYQLLQAGVEVAAVLDASPRIGGYLVHAAKIRRTGVPILVRHSVRTALGKESVTGAVIQQLDEKWQPIAGTEQTIDCDAICLAVGLTPFADLLWQCGCEMKFIPELGGHTAVRGRDLQTSVEGIYLAGDVAGIEEASSAMVEGSLAGLNAAISLGYGDETAEKLRYEFEVQLNDLRSGPVAEKIRSGLSKVSAN
ncbi:MAG: NAD(P)/FAD-dependent oxidoreductase [Negativicutes bacterium]|nr:NAD(P)/FAD-dependent oxidoreductase [Negativicutes bacterium]